MYPKEFHHAQYSVLDRWLVLALNMGYIYWSAHSGDVSPKDYTLLLII